MRRCAATTSTGYAGGDRAGDERKPGRSRTNKIGIYYAYWEHDWDADFVPYVERAKRLGFDVLEINAGTVRQMSPTQRDTLVGSAQDSGVALTACIGLPQAMDPASPDRQTRERGVAFLKQSAADLGRMNIRKLSGIIYGSWPATLLDSSQRAQYVDRSVESMKEASKAAEDNEVQFNVEVVNRFEQYIINTAEEAVAYVERIGSPTVKILLDTFHMNIEEDDPAAAVRQAGEHLGHFHLGETNRRPPGKGRFPWPPVFSALKAIGFDGHLVMEPFLLPGGEVGRDIKVYRDLTDGEDPDSLAREALLFVRESLG